MEGIKISYMGKYKHGATVDTYFELANDQIYDATFECVGQDGKVFLAKDMAISKGTEQGKQTAIASFAMTDTELETFKQLKEVRVTLKQQKVAKNA